MIKALTSLTSTNGMAGVSTANVSSKFFDPVRKPHSWKLLVLRLVGRSTAPMRGPQTNGGRIVIKSKRGSFVFMNSHAYPSCKQPFKTQNRWQSTASSEMTFEAKYALKGSQSSPFAIAYSLTLDNT